MHVAVDEALAARGQLGPLRRAVESLPPITTPPIPPRNIAASPAWLDESESAQVRGYARALHRLLLDFFHVLHRERDARRRLRLPARAILGTWRGVGPERAMWLANAVTSFRLQYAARLPEPVVGTRSDGFFVGGRFRVIEMNAGFRGHRFLDALAESYSTEPSFAPALRGKEQAGVWPALASAVARRHERLASTRDSVVAMLDAREADEPERAAFARALDALGVPAVRAPARDFSWDGAAMRVGRRRVTVLVDVDLVRASSHLGLPERVRWSMLKLVANRAGAVELFPLPYSGIFSKVLIALISDGSLRGLVDGDALDEVNGALVWTRLAAPGQTTWTDGARSELREICLRHRQELILKPIAGLGGLGVVLGDELDDAAWRTNVDRALWRRDHVVQERLRPEPIDIVSFDPEVVKRRVIADVAPVMVDDQVAAVISRFADNAITNVMFNRLRKSECFGILPMWLSKA